MKRAVIIGAMLILALPVRSTTAATAGESGPDAALNRQEPRRVHGDYRISRSEVVRTDLVVEGGHLTVDGEIRGWVVVKDGDATIRGTVEGTVVVIYGNVQILGDGLVQGDAVSIGGNVGIRDSGVVTGSNISTTVAGLRRQGREVEWARIVRRAGFEELATQETAWNRPDQIRDWERDSRQWHRYRRWGSYDFLYDGNFPLGFFAYNRIDGFTFQGQIFNSQRDWGPAAISFYGGLGYGFSSRRIYYRLGLSRYWLPDMPIEIGGSVHRQLESEDTWYLYPNENDLYALFARYDYQDYYLTDGWQAYLRVTPMPRLHLGARYLQESEEAVERETNWALFGKKDGTFRENDWLTTWDPDPAQRVFAPADEGDLKRLVYFVQYDLGYNAYRYRGFGLNLEASLENVDHQGLVSGGGAFTYERLMGELKGRLSLSRVDHLWFRVRAASAKVEDGFTLPVQHCFYLGGIGTLRGYDFKQLTGDRLFLGTVEYTLGGSDWSPFFNDWALSLFFDYGLAWYTDPGTGLYTDLYPDKGMRSVGLGIAPFGSDFLKVELARPLDGESKEVSYYIRLMVDF